LTSQLRGARVRPRTPADFKKFVADELRLHAEMVRVAGLKPE